MGPAGIISTINWVDVLIVILLIRISYVGFQRGLGSEVVPLMGVFFALVLTMHYYSNMGEFVASHTPLPEAYSNFISFIILALLIKFIFFLIEALIIGKIITVHIASLYDNLGGLAFGIMRGILLASIVVIALGLTPNDYIRSSASEKSIMGERFLNIGQTVHRRVTTFFKLK